MPPMRVWFPLFGAYCILAMVMHVMLASRAQRLLRETQGRVCRGCGYAYGEIEADKCPECGRAREKDESTPLL